MPFYPNSIMPYFKKESINSNGTILADDWNKLALEIIAIEQYLGNFNGFIDITKENENINTKIEDLLSKLNNFAFEGATSISGCIYSGEKIAFPENVEVAFLSKSLYPNDTTIYVNSTDGFPDAGMITLLNKMQSTSGGTWVEYIKYSSKTNNSFLNCSRGYLDTTKTKHTVWSAYNTGNYDAMDFAVENNTLTSCIMLPIGNKLCSRLYPGYRNKIYYSLDDFNITGTLLDIIRKIRKNPMAYTLTDNLKPYVNTDIGIRSDGTEYMVSKDANYAAINELTWAEADAFVRGIVCTDTNITNNEDCNDVIRKIIAPEEWSVGAVPVFNGKISINYGLGSIVIGPPISTYTMPNCIIEDVYYGLRDTTASTSIVKFMGNDIIQNGIATVDSTKCDFNWFSGSTNNATIIDKPTDTEVLFTDTKELHYINYNTPPIAEFKSSSGQSIIPVLLDIDHGQSSIYLNDIKPRQNTVPLYAENASIVSRFYRPYSITLGTSGEIVISSYNKGDDFIGHPNVVGYYLNGTYTSVGCLIKEGIPNYEWSNADNKYEVTLTAGVNWDYPYHIYSATRCGTQTYFVTQSGILRKLDSEANASYYGTINHDDSDLVQLRFDLRKEKMPLNQFRSIAVTIENENDANYYLSLRSGYLIDFTTFANPAYDNDTDRFYYQNIGMYTYNLGFGYTTRSNFIELSSNYVSDKNHKITIAPDNSTVYTGIQNGLIYYGETQSANVSNQFTTPSDGVYGDITKPFYNSSYGEVDLNDANGDAQYKFASERIACLINSNGEKEIYIAAGKDGIHKLNTVTLKLSKVNLVLNQPDDYVFDICNDLNGNLYYCEFAKDKVVRINKDMNNNISSESRCEIIVAALSKTGNGNQQTYTTLDCSIMQEATGKVTFLVAGNSTNIAESTIKYQVTAIKPLT